MAERIESLVSISRRPTQRPDAGATDHGDDASGPVALSEDERELVLQELGAVGPGIPSARRQGYDELARAVAGGEVSNQLVPLLERVVGVALETGRARRLYLAEGEGVLNRVFRKLPGGRALDRSVEAVNAALAVVAGRGLRGLRLSVRVPGHYTLAVDADGAKLTLGIRPDAVTVESLEGGAT